MIEKHPFGNFVPKETRYLLLGSFAGRPINGYDWFYANGRNHFWPIMEAVYGTKLPTKGKKQELFKRLKIAISDVILSCERKANNNLDTNLTSMVFNTWAITNILRNKKVKIIFFSSRFAENLFKKHFKDVILKYPGIKLVTLPSPSPRYAKLSKLEKVAK